MFDEDVTNYIPPSTRQGQLMRILHAIEKAEGGTRTDFAKPFTHFQQFLKRRGIVVVISDFYDKPEEIVKVIEPLRYRGNEVVLFHISRSEGDRAEVPRSRAAAGRRRRYAPWKSRPNTRATNTSRRSTST